MNTYLLKGNLCYSEGPDRLRLVPDAYLLCMEGRCAGIFQTLPERYAALPVEDFSGRLLIPGMTDLHLHAPQFSFRGLGMDMELLDWLNTHTFPEEARYADLEYARLAYSQFTACLRRGATTRAAVFATVHRPATELLMQLLEDSGLITYVGKVNMDRNSPDSLREPDAAASLAETERWLADLEGHFTRTFPILTPRFIPSCSDELLAGLGKLSQRYGLPVQSHLSENLGEIAWVQELCPDAEFYADAYDRFGLLGREQPCIMAHCVHSCDRELERMRNNGVYVAHSPLSNTNLSSGVAPVSRYLKAGLHVGLASDVAGGETENLFRVLAGAIQASKLRWRLLDQSVAPLTVEQAFYMATLGGGSFFGQVGSFAEGYALDALVLDDSALVHPQELDLRARLERLLYLGDERQIIAKYVDGVRLF